ncbi:MAG: CPBP family intramembrane metalloprotease [Nitrososphaerota archaeon]|nr:CPBP family intramembrane metalloprotease [Nitrososphaerota archaeon]MDG6924172.1 CPBP family intramembrane metalloprotease [Nitrososphaerota archaeon]
MKSSSDTAVLGGVFVVCLFLLLFLLNGDGVVLSSLSADISQYVSTIEQILAYLVVAGFATIIMKSQGISWRAVGITKRNLYLAFPVLAALGVATTSVAWLGGDWPSMSLSTQLGVTLPLPVVILVVFTIAVVEEYIFRGYVQVGTARRFGVTAGMIVSAAVFALAHVPVDISGLGVTSSATLASALPSLSFLAIGRFSFGLLAFAGMYQLTGNIFITIITHSFYDFSVVYYPPAGGTITIVFVCLILPFIVVFLMQALRRPDSSRLAVDNLTSVKVLKY